MKEEIIDFGGIYKVGWYGIKEMTPYLAHCIVYAIEYKDGFILIDCGNGFTGREILKNLECISTKKVTHILLTHCHYDHSLNSLFFKEKGAKILCHYETAISFTEKTYRVWYEFPHLVKPFKPDMIFSKDEKFKVDNIEISCIHTPGHTSGCFSYYLTLKGKKFLFTGDLLMPEGEIGWAGSENFNKNEILKSLEKIKNLEFDFLLGGHHYSNGKEGRVNVKYAIEKGKSNRWKVIKEYHL